MIAEHKAREKEWLRLNQKLEDAEWEARKAHSNRPALWIKWRDCDAKDASGINYLRRHFLERPGADRKQIEKEYQDAKVRLAAAAHACTEWDQRAGIASLRKQYERTAAAEKRAATRMARTKPATLAGAAALLAYLQRDVEISLGSLADWHMIALKTAAVALARMNKEAA